MAYHLNVKLDRKLEAALKEHADGAGISISADVRDLLRVALGVVTAERTRGWLEGRSEGYAEVLRNAAGAGD